MSIESEKFASIQALRGIAATVVLLAHICAQWPVRSHLKVILEFGAHGVDLFFVISGFVMVYASQRLYAKPGASLQFFVKRLVRIVPLYWTCTTFWWAYLIYIRVPHGMYDMSINQIIGSYMFVPIPRPSGDTSPALGVGWTLNIEMVFYIVFAFAIIFPRQYAIAVASLILAGLMYIVMLVASHSTSHMLAFYNTPLIYEFIVGMVFGLLYCEGIRLSSLASAIVFGIGLWIFAYYCVVFHYYSNWNYGNIAIALGLMVAAPAMCKTVAKDSIFSKIAFLFGDSSYALYLTHLITLTIIADFFYKTFGAIAHPRIFFFLQLFFCITIAFLVHLYIEKPVTLMLKRKTKPMLVEAQPVPA